MPTTKIPQAPVSSGALSTVVWALMPCAVIAVLVGLHLRRRYRARRQDEHFRSARALTEPRTPQGRTAVGTAARAPERNAIPALVQSRRMVTSERVVLAASYLRAVAAGDQTARKEVLRVSSSSDLIAGLMVVTQMLADEFGDATNQSADAVLDTLHRRAVTRHREIVVMASRP